MNTQIARVLQLPICSGAKDWLQTQKDCRQAWNDCQRSDWMLWLLQFCNNAGQPTFQISLAKLKAEVLQDEKVALAKDAPLVQGLEVFEAFVLDLDLKPLCEVMPKIKALANQRQSYMRKTSLSSRLAFLRAQTVLTLMNVFEGHTFLGVYAHYKAYKLLKKEALSAESLQDSVWSLDDAVLLKAFLQELARQADIIRRHFPCHPEIPEMKSNS